MSVFRWGKSDFTSQRNATIKANTIERKPFVRLRRRRKRKNHLRRLKISLCVLSFSWELIYWLFAAKLPASLCARSHRFRETPLTTLKSNTDLMLWLVYRRPLPSLPPLSSASVRALTLVAQHLRIIGAFHSRRLGVTRRVALSPGVFWDVLWCEAASTLSSDHSCLKTD